MSPIRAVFAAALALASPAWACDDLISAQQPFLAGEVLTYEVDRVSIVGIPGLVKAEGRITLAVQPSGPGTTAILSGQASAKAPLMKPYEISITMASTLDPATLSSRGFSHSQRTSNGGPDNFDHTYIFHFDTGRWHLGDEIRRLPERPQDMVSSVYFARALPLRDLDCSMERYFDRRQNPMRLRSRSSKDLEVPWTGAEVPTREVRWEIAEPRGSITGGSVFVSDDAARLPLRFELHFSFATIGMRLVKVDATPVNTASPAPPPTAQQE